MQIHIRLAALTIVAIASADAFGQAGSQGPWWPSEWGPEDERGAANRLTPAKILEAVALIKRGRTYELGRKHEAGMPIGFGRYFSLVISGNPIAVR